MRLLEAQLTNFKCFGDPGPKFPFGPGINVLTGPNGAGKSSVLEAIGLALFRSTPEGTTLGGLRRLGGGRWQLTVRFEAQDRLRYRVERSEDRCVLVLEGREEELATGVGAVGTQLTELLGLDPELPPDETFRRILGSPQGDATRDLELPEPARRRLFDPLFKVDRFKALDASLAPVTAGGALLRKTLEPLEDEARSLRQLAVPLKESEVRKEELTRSMHEGVRRREATAEELRQVRTALDVLLDRQGERRRLHQELAIRRQTLAGTTQQLEECRRRLEDATRARLQRDAHEPGAQRHQRAREQLKEMEPARSSWKRIKRELRELEAAVQALTDEVAGAEQRRDDLRRATDEGRERLETMGADLARLGAEVDHIDEAQNRRRAALSEGRSNLARARETLLGAGQSLRELEATHEEQDDRRRRLETLQERARLATYNLEEQGRLPQLSGGLRRLRHRHSKILGQLELLEKERVILSRGQCPFVALDCPGLVGIPLVEQLDGTLQDLNRRRVELDREIEEYEAWLVKAEKAELTRSEGETAAAQARELEEEIRRIDARLRSRLDELGPALAAEHLLGAAACLERIDGMPLTEVGNQIERLRGAAVHSVERARAPLDAATQILDDLGERLRAAAEHQNKARSRRDETREETTRLDEKVRHLRHQLDADEVALRQATAEVEDSGDQLRGRERELDRLREQAAPYRNLDDEEARLREVSTDTERDYHEWLRLEAVALEDDARRQRVAVVEREQRRLREEAEDLERTLSRDEGGGEEAEALATRRDQLTGEESRLANQVRNDLAQLEELTDLVERMRAAQDRARDLQREVDAYQRAGNLLNSLRRVFQNAAPKLAGRYLGEISREATRGYRSLTPDAPAEVCWGEDYRVRLRGRFGAGGAVTEKDLAFLSGGERVAVSLALRMALARVFSRAGLLFLDEPTAHLDEGRQAALVAHLDQASRELGFDQVLVVTHDSCFDAIPHHSLRVAPASPT